MRHVILSALMFVAPAVAFAQVETPPPPTPTPTPTPVPVPTPPPTVARYVDATDWPTNEAGWDRFSAIEANLSKGFDQVCGDTFCEGDFGNLRPMGLRCSVDSTKATVRQCVWTFAGSYSTVNAKTGSIAVTAKAFRCKLPLAKDTPAEMLFQALAQPDALDAKLPMSAKSIYDGLVDCL